MAVFACLCFQKSYNLLVEILYVNNYISSKDITALLKTQVRAKEFRKENILILSKVFIFIFKIKIKFYIVL